ncbi:MAG: histidine phosphatase family protein [Nanoarchaeota archaeon]|nr:histidine phosphatase family protein [Nanoarchaeota archaeon]
MGTFYIARHPRTEDDVTGGSRTVKGRSNSSLTDRGLLQAHYLSKFLSKKDLQRVRYSPSGRTKDQLQIIRQDLGEAVFIEEEPRLAERDFGPWTGQTYYDIGKTLVDEEEAAKGIESVEEEEVLRALMYQPEFKPLTPNYAGDHGKGESFNDMADRAWDLANEYVGKHADKNVAFLTHRVFGNIFLNALRLASEGMDKGEFSGFYERYHFPWQEHELGALHIVKMINQGGNIKMRVQHTNYTNHLMPLEHTMYEREISGPTKEDAPLIKTLREIISSTSTP